MFHVKLGFGLARSTTAGQSAEPRCQLYLMPGAECALLPASRVTGLAQRLAMSI